MDRAFFRAARGGNIPTPINAGPTTQTKQGDLTIGGALKKVDGFQVSREEAPVFEKGREYWIQLVGFNGNDRGFFSSKKFIFK